MPSSSGSARRTSSRALLGSLVSQLYEGSRLEAVLRRLFRLAFWVLAMAPLILVPVYYLLLAPVVGPVLAPVFAPLFHP